jgi:hypothetical protein
MSIASHHTEWLSLIEISGPFLSMPVLLRVFPQGLDTVDANLHRLLRPAYEEWLDNQASLHRDEAIHTQWLRFVLANALDMEMVSPTSQPGLLTGAALPPFLRVEVKEYGELLSPDYALMAPAVPRPYLLIQQYPYGQDLNKPIPGHRWTDSPAMRMMQLLRATEVRLGLLTNGDQWMLIDAPRNETTAFVTWEANLWTEEPLTLRAFCSLLHLRRFSGVAAQDTLSALLAESANNQQDVTNQLGYQVRRAVEVLLQSLDRVDKESGRSLLASYSEAELYEAALTVMMRLVFLLSAEERKLLPFGESLYDQYYAASTLQGLLREQADQHGEEVLERRYDAWSRLLALFRVVHDGVEHPDLRLRAYDGRLFDPDRFPFLEGRAPSTTWREEAAAPLFIDNRTVLHLLEALQLLQVKVPGGGQMETRRLSFRALDVEQIGHVYEGLLDHTARRATEPILSLNSTGQEGIELSLLLLEDLRAKGEQPLLDLLKEKTGRSPVALQKALTYQPDLVQFGKLKRACADNDPLLRRVLPFAGLLRSDSFGNPLVVNTGSIYMTAGSDRRTTGTHYTPRSLTEPLVQHTLDPLVYIGPADGLPREQWRLRSVQEIFALKVCDFAMGSGAFLVQVCRYLAQRLVEAWEDAEGWRHAGDPPFTTEGRPSQGIAGEVLLPQDKEERLAYARRLIAERCLYGVDKNPMAVEMAKLSLWLITLHKDRPFTFLNHALCCGDALLGVNIQQLTNWSMDPNPSDDAIRQLVWFQRAIKDTITATLNLRYRLRQIPNDDIKQVEEKARLLKEANETLEVIRLGADLLIAETLNTYHKPSRADLPNMSDYTLLVQGYEDHRLGKLTDNDLHATREQVTKMRAHVNELLGDRNPFHWPLMYPEAFLEEQNEQPGFAAVVSNPPFQGGKRITGALDTDYREYLVEDLANAKRGHADLCAYFFLRASNLVRYEGSCGLLATNTIAQGDTREVGLDQIISHGWTIPRAIPSRKWPGEAGLEVAHVWLRHGEWGGDYLLDEKAVEGITPFLSNVGSVQGEPHTLAANQNKSFIGSYVLGMGFVLQPEEAKILIEKDPRNKDVLFPFMNGEDLNSRIDQSPSTLRR